MAFTTQSFTLSSVPTLLCNPKWGNINDPVPVAILNFDATATLYLGGSTVTTANGFPLLAQTGITFKLLVSDPLYAVVASGSLDCRVMIGRQ